MEKMNRYKVVKVTESQDVKILEVEHIPSGGKYDCQLSGSWRTSFVTQGDIIHLQSEQLDGQSLLVDDAHGLVIVEPDDLIPAKMLSKSETCMLQALLEGMIATQRYSEQLKSSVIGIIVHDIFLNACRLKLRKTLQLRELAEKCSQKESIKTKLSRAGIEPNQLTGIVEEFFPSILKCIESYFLDKPGPSDDESVQIQVNAINEIEKSIWCPSLGLVSTIDAICEVTIHENSSSREAVVPLELKTGRASSFYFKEHKCQIILCAMMMKKQGYNQCDGGILIHLKTEKNDYIPKMTWNQIKRSDEVKFLRGRNDLAYYLSLDKSDLRGPGFKDVLVPKVRMSNPGNRMDHIFIGCLMAVCFDNEKIQPPNSALWRLAQSELSHLNLENIEFFIKWMRLVAKESREKKRNIGSPFWTESSISREQKKLGIGNLVSLQAHRKKVTFKRASSLGPQDSFGQELLHKKVAISVDEVDEGVSTRIAEFIGFVVNATCDTIEVDTGTLVRDFDNSKTYQIDLMDACRESFHMHQNLVSSMMRDTISVKLRDIIIKQDGEKKALKFQGIGNLIEAESSAIYHLNGAQKHAVSQIINETGDCLLIRGISGSGRITVIIAVVKILLMRGKSILISSHSRDNLNYTRNQFIKANVDFIRGPLHSQPITGKDPSTSFISGGNQRVFFHQLQIGDIPCLSVSTVPNRLEKFDYCIVNDASQIVLPAVLGPILISNRFVLIGDENQLPPTVHSDNARAGGFGESLFSLLLKKYEPLSLKMQYTRNQEILKYCNTLFYRKALRCASDKVAKAVIPKASRLTGIPWLDCVLSDHLGQAFLFLDTDHGQVEETDDTNSHDGATCCEQIVNAFKEVCDIPSCDIGVICLLQDQVSLFREKIKDKDVRIDTGDNFRDEEKMIIIFPVMEMEADCHGMESIDVILSDARLLNVALTRTTRKLVLIGSRKLLAKYEVTFGRLFNLMSEKKIIQM